MKMERATYILCLLSFGPSHIVSAWFTAIGPDQPIVAALGEYAILPCHTSIPDELKEIRYFKSIHKHLLNLFKNGKVQQECDLREYVERTELVKDNIAHGSVALKILNVTIADEGVYYCYLQTRSHFDTAEFELKVTALGSYPRIEIESFQDGRVSAMCRSDGWYPEPTVLVIEDEGQMVVLNASGVTLQQQDNLFSVAYYRVITEDSNRTFFCLLRTPYHSERMSSLYVTDLVFRKTPMPRSHEMVIIAEICFIPAVLVVVGVLYCFKRCRKNARDKREKLNLEKGEQKLLLQEKVKEKQMRIPALETCIEECENELNMEKLNMEKKNGEQKPLLQEKDKDKLNMDMEKENDPIIQTTGPDETIALLRKEMNSLVLKWQKELEKKNNELRAKDQDLRAKDQVNEDLKKKLELFKMMAGSEKVTYPRRRIHSC